MSNKKVAIVFTFNSKGLMLWGKRRDTNKYTSPAGHLNEGEDPLEGAKRELKEEANLTTEDWGYLGEVPGGKDGTVKLYVFKAVVDGEADSSNDPDKEVDKWEWFDVEKGLPKDLAQNLQVPQKDNKALALIDLAKQELAKMAILNIPKGKFIREDQEGYHSFNYNHVLPPEQQKNYDLIVEHHKDVFNEPDGLQNVMVKLYRKNPYPNEPSLGRIDGNIEQHHNAIDPSMVELNSNHHGRGLGMSMYEALYAHSAHHLGIKNVKGGDHSTLASAAHNRLARKHGMDYVARRQKASSTSGSFDSAFKPYQYTIKDEMDITKKDIPTFPNLQITQRPQVPIVTTKDQLRSKQLAAINATAPNKKAIATEKKKLQNQDPTKQRGATVVNADNAISYATGGNLVPQPNSNRIQGTQIHESFHLLMNEVEKLHGHAARKQLATKLLQAVPKPLVQHMQRYQNFATGTSYTGHPIEHEELIARLFNYLNSKSDRDHYHISAGHSPSQARIFHGYMKQAHRAILQAGEQADESWLGKIELEKSVKNQLRSIVAATILAQAPVETQANDKLHEQTTNLVNEKGFKADGLHPELKAIAHLESNFGQNMNHKIHPFGPLHTAVGALGLKPITGHSEYMNQKHLRVLFPKLENIEDFNKEFRSNHNFYNQIANSHWKRLKKMFGSTEKAAFAWRWGQTAAMNATPERLAGDVYANSVLKILGKPPMVIPPPQPPKKDPKNGKE